MDGASDSEKSVAVYLCNECKVPQNIVFTPAKKKEFILNDAEFQARGLALYSDTHICKYGILGTNSLFIDHNLDVRSYNYIQLPKFKRKKKLSIPMPGAPKVAGGDKDEIKKLTVTHLREKNEFNITLYNDYSESLLIFGNPDIKNKAPTKTLTSNMGMVSLKYYPSNAPYTSQMEKWLECFINNFEILPPSRLGLVLEVINFILDEKANFPSDFDDMIIKTILASHEIYFELNEMQGTEVLNAYGPNEALIMKEILRLFQLDPMKPLHTYSLELKEDIVFVIYCFLLLERHGFLIINRPGIMVAGGMDMSDLMNL